MSTLPARSTCILLTLACACGDAAGGADGAGPSSGGSGSTGGASSGGASGADSSGEPPTGGTFGGSQSGTTETSSTGDPGSSSTGDPGGSSTGFAADMGGPPARLGRCGDEPPPGATLAPEIPKYAGTCPILDTGYVEGQAPNVLVQTIGPLMYERTFLVIVPDDIGPDERLPVMFMWHWLGGSGKDFYERADAQEAVNEKRFIAVIPDGRSSEEGVLFKWPFSIADLDASMEAEFQLFEDMLACVHEQFNVDKDCVGSVGVSAGALFTDQLAGHRGERLSSFLSLSGGTGGTFVKPWHAPEHRMPALVLWGGPEDKCIVIDFQETSKNLEEQLIAGGHFVLECIHNCNHSTPPFDVPEDMTDFAPLWDFLLDHPYWLEPGQSPYNTEGLPASMPAWCAIGAGNAVPPPGVCDKNECS